MSPFTGVQKVSNVVWGLDYSKRGLGHIDPQVVIEETSKKSLVSMQAFIVSMLGSEVQIPKPIFSFFSGGTGTRKSKHKP